MTRVIGYVLVLGLLAGSPTAAENEDAGQARALMIRLEGGLLTVHATEMPHRQILEGLAKRLQFELIIAGPLEGRRSVAIDRRPGEEVLKRVLSPASWAFVYETSAGAPALAKVFVFPSHDDGTSPVHSPTHASRVASPAPTPPPGADPGAEASPAELLNAEDPEVRALALVALATAGGGQASAVLQEALQDQEPWIRKTAVETLAAMGGEEALQGLQHALQDEQEDVRSAAQEALLRLESPAE